MKKIQVMMAAVLVALVAFAVQSCGSDNDDNRGTMMYKLAFTITFQNKGDLTNDQIEALKEKFKSLEKTGEFLSDRQAESDTDALAQKMASIMKKEMDDEPVKFTLTIITTNLTTKNQVCKWELVYDNGSVMSQKF